MSPGSTATFVQMTSLRLQVNWGVKRHKPERLLMIGTRLVSLREPESEEEEHQVPVHRRLFWLAYLSDQAWVKQSYADVLQEDLMQLQRVTLADVEKALRRIPSSDWANKGRDNVRPAGVAQIDSMTLGLVSSKSTRGTPLTARATKVYPNLSRLLLRFWKQHLREDPDFRGHPALCECAQGCESCKNPKKRKSPPLVCTSIQLNRNYAARPHTDSNNAGMSFIIACGDFTEGGQLWVHDSKGRSPFKLTSSVPGRAHSTPYRRNETINGKYLDVHGKWASFDGRKLHFVVPFKGGDRFSIVFFATRTAVLPSPVRAELANLGFLIPPKLPAADTNSVDALCSAPEHLPCQSWGRADDWLGSRAPKRPRPDPALCAAAAAAAESSQGRS